MSFLEIFQPGLRHLREERNRQQLIVPRPRASGPPLGIDLDRGTAVIRLPVPGDTGAAIEAEPEPLERNSDESDPRRRLNTSADASRDGA